MRKVEVRIDKSGKAHFDFDGFQGDECFLEREKILELLSKYGIQIRVEEEHKKAEAYEEVFEEVRTSW